MSANVVAVAFVGAAVFGCASPRQVVRENTMQDTVRPFLLFQDGRAEEAMRFYVGLFADSEVLAVERYGQGAAGKEGSLEKGHFMIGGLHVMCTDSTAKGDFDFTPSMSLFVECSAEQELDRLFEGLSAGGSVFMPPDSYGFSEKFAWVNDKYSISWQLNLPHPTQK